MCGWTAYTHCCILVRRGTLLVAGTLIEYEGLVRRISDVAALNPESRNICFMCVIIIVIAIQHYVILQVV
jgi:hypothetical protein